MTRIIDPTVRGLVWTKSSYSGGDNNCVEVAFGAVPAALPVRDSKRPAGPAVVFADSAWGGFVDAVKRGDVA
ncbi:hypothetical protein AQJ23_45320 [Streptomyces antibioticus]|nr:DUF397 domain-containing protein [Streptomyces antibioticus]KUN16101.1 hypothetical protein AQJ23_45320 [Streptomyces antibioticus]